MRARTLPDLVRWCGDVPDAPTKEEWDELRRAHEELVRCDRVKR